MLNCSVDLFGLAHCDSSAVLSPSRGRQSISVSLVSIRGEMSGNFLWDNCKGSILFPEARVL